MHLIVEYPFGMGNQGFQYVFDRIYQDLSLYYPFVTKEAVNTQEKYPECGGPSGRCGTSALKIINAENKKTTLLSFWDRTLDMFGHEGWEELDIVHCIGGLGIYLTPEQILKEYNIKFSSFLYPLEFMYAYDYIKQFRKPYNPNERIRKACFVGNIYESREEVAKILRKHPLFDIYGLEDGYFKESYYKKINEYALTLSFNGGGEWCIRDFESMGLGIPIFRSETKTQLYKGIHPNTNYIIGSVPSDQAFIIYPGYSLEEIAYQFIENIEKNINNDDLLISISKNNLEYYDNYLLPNKIADEFFNVFDLDILK